ncbi:TetR/AcrR family transcriptional regulator [Nocardia sp. BSTN01]|uniref:TetR/AcrR family transcriptional regulator n=1 Tax=Nocardia sp. BSTN01 TaxID=2783665 RepID=UPI0018900648|nr:TetR/AcrR family transcriptional regulator [Nocardia sp. BSTN01]MBF5000499.1 TetR/AcrR family transcriptional regulator [Nocardia sp. BSTN01]
MGDARTERWVEHRAEVRRQLVAAATRAIDDIGPQVSMREIAAEAKVPKPTLYRFFKDKGELAAAIGDQAREDIIEELTKARESSVETIGELIDVALTGHAALIDQHPNIFKFLVFGADSVGSHALENSRAIAREISTILETILRAAGGRSVEDAMYGPMIVGLVTGAADAWMRGAESPRMGGTFVERVRPAVRALVGLAGAHAGVDIDFDAPVLARLPVFTAGEPGTP